jgi:hypothetical protein
MLSPCTRWLLLCLCVLALLPIFASPVAASSTEMLTAPAFLQAGVTDWLSDRARMIQLSLVVVTLGIAIMWWTK